MEGKKKKREPEKKPKVWYLGQSARGWIFFKIDEGFQFWSLGINSGLSINALPLETSS